MNQCGGSELSPADASVLPKVGGRTRRITRVGYTRRSHSRSAFSRKGHIHVRRASVKRSRVPTARIRDQGAPGKWREVNQSQGIQVTHPGALSSVGYVVTSKPTRRHAALRKAVDKFGPLSTFRKLRAVSTFTKRTSKGRSKKFKADSNWVEKKYL
jgi:hypothetical protein